MTPSQDIAFSGAFANKRVLVTGHTGFKGGWLAFWLARLGAQVTGLALPPEDRSFYASCGLARLMDSRFCDITDRERLNRTFGPMEFDLIVHMAAQPLVRKGYRMPLQTFATNVAGTCNVLELARKMRNLSGVIVVTSDKCYENREWGYAYRENDPLGGSDPYSASKAATEMLAQSYARSFFSEAGGPRIATVRAGNVLGGGDWAEDRIVPDLVRSALSGEPVRIRRPDAVRPWQHVLDPLAGYLTIGAGLMGADRDRFAGAWNFGPDPEMAVDVGTLARLVRLAWGEDMPAPELDPAGDGAMHEAGLLRLDTSKARVELGWKPLLSLPEGLELATRWYRRAAEGHGMAATTEEQIAFYTGRMMTLHRAAPPFNADRKPETQPHESELRTNGARRGGDQRGRGGVAKLDANGRPGAEDAGAGRGPVPQKPWHNGELRIVGELPRHRDTEPAKGR
jgi:CDP-glucose 4,6-dehydratase